MYINASGGRIKDVRLQWGEVPSSIGMHYVMITVSLLLRDRGRGCKRRDSDYNSPHRPLSSLALIGDSHVMGWGSKAIEIRAVESGQLDGVFMHKRTQKLRFLCERNDKVSAGSVLTSLLINIGASVRTCFVPCYFI